MATWNRATGRRRETLSADELERHAREAEREAQASGSKHDAHNARHWRRRADRARYREDERAEFEEKVADAGPDELADLVPRGGGIDVRG